MAEAALRAGGELMRTNRSAGSLVLLGMRIVLGAIFLLAGLTKVQSPGSFAEAIRVYHLLPSGLVAPFALVLPWLEILVAAYLLVGFLSRLAALGSAAMLAMFVIALTDALLTGNTAHACGCFGGGLGANPVLSLIAGGSSIGWWDVFRDLILLGLSLLLVARGAGAYSLDAFLARHKDQAYTTIWEES